MSKIGRVLLTKARPSSVAFIICRRSLSVRLPVDDKLMPMYVLGVSIGKQVGTELKTLLSKEEVDAVLVGFGEEMTDKVADMKTLMETYAPALNVFLKERAVKKIDMEKQKGVDFINKYLLLHSRAQKTPSGMIYNETFAGIGAQPTSASTVTVHYHGTLTDGTVFDSSVNRGEPISFPLGQVIRGWQEGIPLMRVGGKATLVIPSDLAYGDQGSPPAIPAAATLMFDVELISIN